ncbi:Uncharacterised protein [Raoultella terrigena]|uniref:Uncharacterized protein n=1 Tax=Raoultella terrigena TaxID=577 RepID=A0A4V6J1G7_RAOTE|nr:Uncharacterised protein [Raoultella terrigena]
MAISSTTTAKEQEQQEKKVAIEFFHIDMIPDAMDNMKWTTTAKLMRHWFSIKPEFAFTVQSRRIALNTDAVKLPMSQVNFDIIKMSWAIQYEQVRTGIDELRRLWKSAKGIERLKEQVNKSKFTDEAEVFIGYSEIVRELDANVQVNILPIGSKFDTVNEWYGAIGNTTLKVCVRGKTNRVDGENVFFVDKLGFYLKDTYDFVDEDTAPESLGIWSKSRVLDKKVHPYICQHIFLACGVGWFVIIQVLYRSLTLIFVDGRRNMG